MAFSLAMGKTQLSFEFESAATAEFAADYDIHSTNTSDTILSKEDFIARILTVWNAVEFWMSGLIPAHRFDAEALGVYWKIEPEWVGTFSDADQVQQLSDEYAIAASMAIAVEEAAITLKEHGHPEYASPMVRAFYFGLALNTLGYDLECCMPGIPVHALGL